jgi:NTE family protein
MSSASSLENVLILQGGGSLGAFGCGVFKAPANNNVKLDIIADIIAGSKNDKNPEKVLDQFWLELAEGSKALDSFSSSLYPIYSPSFIQWLATADKFPSFASQFNSIVQPDRNLKIKSILSAYASSVYGNDKFFKPRWKPEYMLADPEYSIPAEWTYLYDHSPLVKTLEKYIDYTKLKPTGGPSNTRLLMTAVNVLTAQPLTFDSYKQQIIPKHILATCGYPLYAFPWIEVESGVYAWDGGLLSNTPLR